MMATGTYNRVYNTSTGTYSFVMEYDFSSQKNSQGKYSQQSQQSDGNLAAGGEALIPATDTQGWPTNPESGVTYTITQRWLYSNFLQAGDVELFTVANEAGDQIRMDVAAGASLKIYRA